jgi:hypothetical protein
MKEIFKDFEIIKLEKDPDTPGVFLKARKPKDCTSLSDLSEISLYSIILGKRTKEISTKFTLQRKCKIFIQNLADSIKNRLRGMLTLK